LGIFFYATNFKQHSLMAHWPHSWSMWSAQTTRPAWRQTSAEMYRVVRQHWHDRASSCIASNLQTE
jgi:hypothetical protein